MLILINPAFENSLLLVLLRLLGLYRLCSQFGADIDTVLTQIANLPHIQVDAKSVVRTGAEASK